MTMSMTTTSDERAYAPAEAAERTGLSIDTLRYYERIGLLPAVPRTVGGRRRYRERDLDTLGLLNCLRDTGMPIREMQRFAALLAAGDSTVPERIALLQEHRDTARSRIAQLQEQVERIERKIAHYEGELG
jgi:DNA-binding transcriptional MerR regulator